MKLSEWEKRMDAYFKAREKLDKKYLKASEKLNNEYDYLMSLEIKS